MFSTSGVLDMGSLAGSSSAMVAFDSFFVPSVLTATAVADVAVGVAVVAGVGVSVEMVVPTFLWEGGVDVEDAVEEADSMDSDLAAATIYSPAALGSFLSGFGALDDGGASGSVGGGGGGDNILKLTFLFLGGFAAVAFPELPVTAGLAAEAMTLSAASEIFAIIEGAAVAGLGASRALISSHNFGVAFATSLAFCSFWSAVHCGLPFLQGVSGLLPGPLHHVRAEGIHVAGRLKGGNWQRRR
jgi:hypothetical protein